MKNWLYLILFLTGFIGKNGLASEILDDFKKLNRHYLEMTEYSMDFEIKYLAAGNGIVMSQQGKVTHTADLHFVRIAGNISLIRKDEFVAVNQTSRTVVYNKSDQKSKKKETEPANISAILDSLWENKEGLSYRYLDAPKGHRKVYVQDDRNQFYSAYSLTINETKYNLIEFVYYVKPEANDQVNKVIISYSNETARPKINLDEYKINYYVTGSGGNVHPSEKYQSYTFINQNEVK